jgi:hypothetical protein
MVCPAKLSSFSRSSLPMKLSGNLMISVMSPLSVLSDGIKINRIAEDAAANGVTLAPPVATAEHRDGIFPVMDLTAFGE